MGVLGRDGQLAVSFRFVGGLGDDFLITVDPGYLGNLGFAGVLIGASGTPVSTQDTGGRSKPVADSAVITLKCVFFISA